VDEVLRPLGPLLKKPKVRQILEREAPEKASEKIVERLRKEEAKNEEGKKSAAQAEAK
jgi:hypothetical protein